MAKKLINLLIESTPEPPIYRILKRISPVISISSLVLFIILYFLSLLYVQFNLKEYNQIEAKTDILEKKISTKKSTESIYISTVGILDTINRILVKDSKIIINNLPAIFDIQKKGILITSSALDNSGPVGLTVKTGSSESLLNFIEELEKSEEAGNFKEIQAAGIIRENDGSYTLTVNLKAIPNKQ